MKLYGVFVIASLVVLGVFHSINPDYDFIVIGAIGLAGILLAIRSIAKQQR